MPAPIVVEPCVEIPPRYDLDETWRYHGRLVLSDEGLAFIHGWDERVTLDLSWVLARVRGHVGAQMLAEIADRPWREQAEVMPRSRVLPFAELSTLRVARWSSRLVAETKRHGDTLVYTIPRRLRPAVSQWVRERSSWAMRAP